MAAPPSQPRAYSQAYLPNGNPSGPVPGATPLLPNQGRVVQANGARVLCIADVRGNLRSLNELARSARADHVIHTGDFGFYDDTSLERIAEKTLKHVAQYSPLLNDTLKNDLARAPPQPSIKERFQRERLPLSELPLFLNGTFRLEVPVYTVWGACEDVSVLEKLRSGEYKIENLHIIDEAHSRLLDVGGVKLRLLGLGGAVVMHKLFDNGEGRTTIAGGQGTMWTTLLQMGELVDTANRVYDPTETRVFVTHASPAREGILNQLSVTLKADFSISAGLHFRYGSSYNEFSVNPTLDHYRGKLAASKASFNDVWETVKHEVEPIVSENESQQRLLAHALEVVNKMPSVANGGNPFGGGQGGPQSGQVDESAFKNMWNFNLADAAFGWLVLDIDQGRIGTEMRAQGFNFAHRGNKTGQRPVAPVTAPVADKPQPHQAAVIPQQPAPQQRAASQGVSQTAAQVLSQNAQARPTGPGAAQPPRAAQSATSPAPPKTTSAPQAHTPGTNGNGASAGPNGNGTPAPAAERTIESPKPKPAPEISNAIYIPSLQNLSDDEMKQQIFSDEDRSKITKIEKTAKGFWIVYFETPEIMNDVLSRSPPKEGRYHTLKLSVYRQRGGRGGGGYAGQWGSSRGGAAGTPVQQSGYRSSGASDSESGRGGRGRGGFRGGRGDRGRGRGGRGGAPGKVEGGTPGSTPGPTGGDA
ncbi:hypothetical protein K461DRAFT_315447 [Myriangium duriaei CBS 260.36]|uniref:DUF2433 domain-containing protein n=1 Tax=Myriangium duriaei CBS 260.36 TaxID=1168546 RepID=A0A9P4MD27_9PEZI|nr:hypothetical protein K461DRAFT_315447 [Myriangium duriaei CBS 260.36]